MLGPAYRIVGMPNRDLNILGAVAAGRKLLRLLQSDGYISLGYPSLFDDCRSNNRLLLIQPPRQETRNHSTDNRDQPE